MKILNNKIDNIRYANVSKLHEYCNKFAGKPLIKICPLGGHILIARSSQVWARDSIVALRSFWTLHFALRLVLFAYIQVYFL